MPTIRLTPSQVSVLRAAARGDLCRSESGADLYACYIRGQRRAVTSVVDRLFALEPSLLRIGERERFTRPILLTVDGEAELAKHPED